MGKRTSEHHRLAKSRCKEFNIDPEDPRNKILKPEKQHRAYHTVFDDMTPEEVLRNIVLEWFPPPSVFNPGLIKDKNLRAYYRKAWQEKNREIIARPDYKCGECGCNVLRVGRVGGISEFNCEMCGQYKCYSCILCGHPARIEVDGDKNFFICGRCLIGFIEKGTHLPKKYQIYSSRLRKWYRSKVLSF